MNRARLRPGSPALAWSLWVVAVALLAAALAFGEADRGEERGTDDDSLAIGLLFAFEIFAFVSVGTLLAARQPRNILGWILAVYGLIFAAGVAADGYARHALFSSPGSLPGGAAAAWVASFAIDSPGLAFGSFVLLFLMFPHGRLPSKLWGWALALMLPALAALQAVFVLKPGELNAFPGIENPLGVAAVEDLRFLETPLFLVLLAFVVASAGSLIRRFLRAIGEERQQLKVVVAACAFLAATIVSAPLWWSGLVPERVSGIVWPVLFATSLASIPIGVGVAVLRYRLYDIDWIINRALVYGTLTAVLAGLYAASVQLFKTVFTGLTGETSDAAIVLTTLVLAAVFTPAKSRLQAVVDHYFRREPDPGKDLREDVELLRRVIQVLDSNESSRRFLEDSMHAMEVAGGAVYLRRDDQIVRVAYEGELDAEAAVRIPMRFDNDEVGFMLLAPRVNGSDYTPEDIDVLCSAADLFGHAIALSAGRASVETSSTKSIDVLEAEDAAAPA